MATTSPPFFDCVPDKRRNIGAGELLHFSDTGWRRDVDLGHIITNHINADKNETTLPEGRLDALADFTLAPGQFGENLTTEGLLEREVGIGDPRFVKKFLRSGRPGVYFRIAESGTLAAGDTIARVERGAAGLTVWHLAYGGGTDRDRMNFALEIPTLGDEWRRPILAMLST